MLGNEKSCAEGSRVVVVPIVVEPVVVRLPMTTVPVEVTNIEVAVRIANVQSAISFITLRIHHKGASFF
jgi:hypothetical protein